MEGIIMDFSEMAQSARRGLEDQHEKLTEKMEQLNDYAKLLDCMDELIGDHRKLRDKYDQLQQQLEEEKRLRAEAEMKLDETNKLSAGMAKKVSEEVFVEMVRPYVTYSKRKKAEKRAYAKSMIMELANINGVMLPAELFEAIESLDDEQSDPKMVVNGDIVMEKNIENKK